MNNLRIAGVSVDYGTGPRTVTVLHDVSLEFPTGRIVGIVGESGSGKSTLARAVAGIVPVRDGQVSLGETTFGPRRSRKDRRRVQMAFQDPSTSLNPRMTVEQTLLDACVGSRSSRATRIDELLSAVGLDQRHRRSLPADLSGGQRQRVSLARALAAEPDVLICDEVTSALDAPTRFAILSLLADLQAAHQFTLLFISHDLGAVRQICDDVVVMYAGQVVEAGQVSDVVDDPQHPYTRVLLDSVPSLDRRLSIVPVDFEPVDPRYPPSGCRFNPRCPVGPTHRADRAVCVTDDPSADAPARLHRTACHFAPRSSDLDPSRTTTSPNSTNRTASAGPGTDAPPPPLESKENAMSRLRRSARLLIAATSGTALLATSACSGTSGSAPSGDVVSDATFTLAITADPGNLNPLGSNLAGVQQLSAFLYDPLVHDEDGEVTAGLASSWELTDSGATFTIRDDVTCSDGNPLTGQDVIDTITYVGDTKNASPLAGSLIPAGTTAAAGPDDTQVTVSTPEPYGFLLNGLAGLPIVCAAGLKDLDELGTSASGSGPYTLESVSAGSRYELKRREDYVWGQDGVTGTTKGLPAKIVVQVVPNETTAANLILAGDLDAATIAGADRKRLEAAGLKPKASSFVFGELEYNQKAGRPTADPAVRVALTQALNLDELRQVATSGTGSTPTRLSGVSPCGDGGVPDALPKQDVDAAKAALGPVGGTTLNFLYLSKLGPAVAAAAELAAEQWKAAGVTVEARGLSDAQLLKAAYETGDFDIAWIPIDGQNPAQIAPSFSGPTPADGGGNFASIDNATYAELAGKAGALPTEEACSIWEDAEEALVSAADVVPFAFSDYPIWAAKTTSFEVNYFGVVPSSIRMHG